MEERNGTGRQEEMLLRLQELYEEREEEFCRREEIFAAREEQLAEKERLLKERGRELEEEAGRRMMEARIVLEEARNEKLKCQRMKEEQEVSATMAEARKEDGTPGGDAPGRAGEMARLCQRLEKELKAKDGIIAELRMGIGKLEEEKAGLFRKLLNLPEDGNVPKPGTHEEKEEDVPKSGTQDRKEEDVPKSGTQDRKEEGVPKSGTQGREEAVSTESGMHEEKEELTAGVLYKYLLKNQSQGTPQIRHADAGDQVWMEDGGLKHVFVFGEPPYFDIRVKRKNSRALSGGWGKEGLLSEYGRQHPGVRFTYDQASGEIVASGYFTQEMAPYDLMAKVGEIATCLGVREEG